MFQLQHEQIIRTFLLLSLIGCDFYYQWPDVLVVFVDALVL